MSEVLGPIHHLMWEKIGYQETIVQELLKHKPQLLAHLDAHQPALPYHRNLAEVLTSSNIHGWLASAIDVTEARLAFAYANTSANDAIDLLRQLGDQARAQQDFADANEVFSALSHFLLDGMPCDRAYRPEATADGFRFTQLADVHAHYAVAPLSVDAALSKDNTCSGTHDHDDHEAFELQKSPQEYGEMSSYAQQAAAKSEGVVSPYYDYRFAWLEGFFDKSDWRLTRLGRTDFAVSHA